jgi:hypothetical protein
MLNMREPGGKNGTTLKLKRQRCILQRRRKRRIVVGSEESGELDFHTGIVRANKRQVNVPFHKVFGSLLQ